MVDFLKTHERLLEASNKTIGNTLNIVNKHKKTIPTEFISPTDNVAEYTGISHNGAPFSKIAMIGSNKNYYYHISNANGPKNPFDVTHVYSAYLVNMQSTYYDRAMKGEERILFPARAFIEDIEFCRACIENNLLVIKANTIYHHKTSFLVPRSAVENAKSTVPGIVEWTKDTLYKCHEVDDDDDVDMDEQKKKIEEFASIIALGKQKGWILEKNAIDNLRDSRARNLRELKQETSSEKYAYIIGDNRVVDPLHHIQEKLSTVPSQKKVLLILEAACVFGGSSDVSHAILEQQIKRSITVWNTFRQDAGDGYFIVVEALA
jgi:hypothetical protein